MKKLTKIEMFTIIKTRLTNPNEIAFIDHEIELLENKKSTNRKPTKNQEENQVYKKILLDTLEALESATITDIQNENEKLKELSNQRISALLTQLVNAGAVVKAYDKRKAYFSLA